MLARFKSRSSLYTLPVVVLAGFTTVAGLAAWQRADTIAELADRIAHGEMAEATAAVRDLAAIPGPPLSILVDAASSDERATAEAAQVALNRLLGEWKQQLDQGQRTSRVAAQLTELATQLAAQRRAFAKADYPWLAGVARKIVRLANRCPAKKTPLVALHCDEVLSAIDAASAGAATVQDQRLPNSPPAVRDAAPPAADAHGAGQERLEREFSELPAPPATEERAGEERAAGATVSEKELPGEDAAGRASSTAPPPSANDEGTSLPSATNRAKDAELGQPPAADDVASRPGWSRPAYRMQPKPPAALPSAADARHQPRSLPVEVVNSSAPSAPVRGLMERWIAAIDGGQEADRVIAQQLLARHGFKPLSEKLVRCYLSPDKEDRAHILDGIIAEPAIDSRPWLILLAEDADVEVRLAAVTMMATSTDAELVEKAWQVALSDRDPRIADLAARLRERRAAARRR